MTKTREAFEAYWSSLAEDGSELKSEILSCKHAAQNAWQAATAAERKPLSDAEIDAVTDTQWGKGCEPNQYLAHRAYARAILKAGIGTPK